MAALLTRLSPVATARARQSLGNDNQFESHALDAVDSFAGGVGHGAVQFTFGHRFSSPRLVKINADLITAPKAQWPALEMPSTV